jgi:hypothetical protein
MTAPQLDASRLQEFARRLAAHPRRRVDRKSLWLAFAQAFPARPQGVEERIWLSAALHVLSREGVITLPSTRGSRWDYDLGVPVPASVDVVVRKPESAEPEWRSFPWHPQLQWVADLRALREDQALFLHAVHMALTAGTLHRPAPLKYRSIQLTGDEKV